MTSIASWSTRRDQQPNVIGFIGDQMTRATHHRGAQLRAAAAALQTARAYAGAELGSGEAAGAGGVL